METSLKQVVLITGCSSGGLGNALARTFAARHCLVAATARTISSMANLKDNNDVYLQELDVLSDQNIQEVVSNVIDKFGRIDIVINNAAVPCAGPLAEIPFSLFEIGFNTNVYGPMRLIQAVVPHMVSKKKGKIVNIGSISALAPGPWTGTYSASKAALHALTDTLRLELQPFGINVINIVPGIVKSNIVKNARETFMKMPKLKLYKNYEGAIRGRADYGQGPKAVSAEEFADKTVAAILKEDPPSWFSLGKYSTIMAMLYHMPIFVRDYIFKMTMMKC